MLQEIGKFHQDIVNASKLGRDIKVSRKDYDDVIFCGVGGSGIIGDIIRALNLDFTVYTVRQNFPRWAGKRTLCFVLSYSGMTKETLVMYKQAQIKGCKIFIITSGGKLEQYKREQDDLIKIPKEYLPREAIAYLLFPVLNILKVDYKECFKVVKRFNRKTALKLAQKIKGKIPIIYSGGENFKYVAYRWQTDFNENAKIFAHSHYFPELAHNEIEAELDDKYVVILLQDKETKVIKKASRMLNPIKIRIKGKSLIGKIIYGIYFGDLTSYYLAKELGKSYAETERIKKLKKS